MPPRLPQRAAPMPHAPPAATRAACALADDRYTRPRSSGTRYRLDGSKIIKVYLDPKEAANVEYKVETFGTVYKKLTGKEVKFEFPVNEH